VSKLTHTHTKKHTQTPSRTLANHCHHPPISCIATHHPPSSSSASTTTPDTATRNRIPARAHTSFLEEYSPQKNGRKCQKQKLIPRPHVVMAVLGPCQGQGEEDVRATNINESRGQHTVQNNDNGATIWLQKGQWQQEGDNAMWQSATREGSSGEQELVAQDGRGERIPYNTWRQRKWIFQAKK